MDVKAIIEIKVMVSENFISFHMEALIACKKFINSIIFSLSLFYDAHL